MRSRLRGKCHWLAGSVQFSAGWLAEKDEKGFSGEKEARETGGGVRIEGGERAETEGGVNISSKSFVRQA